MRAIVFAGVAISCGRTILAQEPKAIVQLAVQAELAANRDDHTHWRYLNHKGAAGETVDVVVETEQGAVSKTVEQGGKPVPASVAAAQDAKNKAFLHDTDAQKKQKKDGAHDDKSAEELLNLLPTAFLWKIERDTPEETTLAFVPDPGFHPPDMESRVMSAMSGTLVVEKTAHRIKSMKGALGVDVTMGLGIVKLRKGGTFNVERRQVGAGVWQITEQHVHIDGRALLFKTIGQQEDEVKTKFTPVPAGTTLEQALGMLAETK